MTRSTTGTVIRGAAMTALAASLLLPARGDAAQAESDAPWLAWLGCWAEAGAAGELLCVRPTTDPREVKLLTVREGEIVETGTLRADDAPRETDREGCRGSERTAFSSDGHRVYLRSHHVCEGGVERSGTGILAFVSPTEWIRVETVDVDGEGAAVTRRFRLAPPERVADAGLEDVESGRGMAVRAARLAASSDLTVDDVTDASRESDTEAVRAWLAERDEPLDVNADDLVHLADAGVAESVVDVVVAVSFPGHFAVDRDLAGDDARRAAGGRPPIHGYGLHEPFYGPFYGPWFHGFPRFGHGYSRFGYRYGRFGYPFGYGRPTVIVVTRGDRDDGGRVVAGRGYTRTRERAREPNRSIGRIDPWSGGSVTPGGMRSGGSGGSSGRTAKPRDDSGSSSDGGG